mmetsp:Transcript_15136/g.27949  ORF Transcript_15136/g.27949 Transcript_15136/m.27949 type:complete len:301 (+) Transcript_15136:14-916(+)
MVPTTPTTMPTTNKSTRIAAFCSKREARLIPPLPITPGGRHSQRRGDLEYWSMPCLPRQIFDAYGPGAICSTAAFMSDTFLESIARISSESTSATPSLTHSPRRRPPPLPASAHPTRGARSPGRLRPPAPWLPLRPRGGRTTAPPCPRGRREAVRGRAGGSGAGAACRTPRETASRRETGPPRPPLSLGRRPRPRAAPPPRRRRRPRRNGARWRGRSRRCPPGPGRRRLEGGLGGGARGAPGAPHWDPSTRPARARSCRRRRRAPGRRRPRAARRRFARPLRGRAPTAALGQAGGSRSRA